MTTPTYLTTCLRNAQLARDVWQFTLRKPKGFAFTAGQYVLMQAPAADGTVEPRAFSIASAPHEDDMLFVAKMKEGGRASEWIKNMLKIDDSVQITGPFGRFILHDHERPALFIGTSTGVAPFRSILRSLPADHPRRIDLIFGAKDEQDLFWQEEFEQLAKEHTAFNLHIALSAPHENWKGHKGRVQTLVPQITKEIAVRDVYVCGNPDMTKELKQLCLQEWHVPKEQLHVEGYI